MASMRASSFIRSYRALCRSPITTSHHTSLNGTYNIRLASSVSSSGGGGGTTTSSTSATINNSDNISATATAPNTTIPTIDTADASIKASDAVKAATETPPAPTSEILQFKWEVAEEVLTKDPQLTSAIIPFAQQSYIQMFLFPYTYAVMYYMDFLTDYMPWWGAIVGTTITCKILFFPLIVRQQKNGIKTHNLLPQSQALQAKLNDAMMIGDAYNTALYRTKLKLLYEENDLSIKERLWPALVQAPMFMSLFFLLRRLTSEPVETLSTGGALWFTNLTIPDPYFILPLITCTSLFALLELGLGVEGASGGAATSMRPIGRWLMRGMPVVLFAIIYNFPAATLLFWTTNNFISLVSALILKHPAVMRSFNIPLRLKHDPASLPLTNQTLSGQIKSAKELGQASRTRHDIRRLDDIAFKKAGVGPLKKTYKQPPPPFKQG